LAQRFPKQWDGEDLDGLDSISVYVPRTRARRIVVVTKEAGLRRWDRSLWPSDLAVVVARGMVTREQARLIGRLDGGRSSPIRFLGDADPMDLHAFVSLRSYLGARRVRYFGISDEFLDALGNGAVPADRLIVLSRFEKAHLRIIESLVDPARYLGPRMGALLRAGHKLETEGLGADLIPAMFEAVLRLPPGRRAASR
jgi:hypothetical protein